MDNQETRLFPFHAINEYMLPEFRLRVIGEVLRNLDKLPPQRKAAINAILRTSLQVPGFRNASAAPLGVKIRGAVTPFERYPEFAALILQGWSEIHGDLRGEIHQVLQGRSFEGLLPVEEDRSQLGGFQVHWPLEETYEALDEAYFTAYPDKKDTSTDDIRLMVVWLVNRLPFDLFAEDDEPEN